MPREVDDAGRLRDPDRATLDMTRIGYATTAAAFAKEGSPEKHWINAAPAAAIC